jgi:conjugative transfer signal peptidase TraF
LLEDGTLQQRINYGYLMKRVAASENDAVTIADDGVRVNGDLLPESAPRRNDKDGRPLPHYRLHDYVLGRDDILLMSDSRSTGFDGRYFGLIHRSQLLTALAAVTTW